MLLLLLLPLLHLFAPVLQAGGALSGLAATLLFHPLQHWLGLPLAGLAGIAWQLTCLLSTALPTPEACTVVE